MTILTLPTPVPKHECGPEAKRFLVNSNGVWEIRAPMPPGTEPMGYALVRPIKYCPWCGESLD